MIPRLGCLFIVVPLVELALLIQMGRWVGVWPTVALVALTGVAGMVLVRREGIRTLARLQQEMAQGRLPGRALLDGAALLVGGALLVTPGVLTDVLAFGLVIPGTRRWLQKWGVTRMTQAMEEGTVRIWMGSQGPGGGPFRTSRGDDGAREEGDDDERGSGPGSGPRPGEIIQD